MRGHSLYQIIPKEPQLVLRITVLDNDTCPLESEECTVYGIDKLEELLEVLYILTNKLSGGRSLQNMHNILTEEEWFLIDKYVIWPNTPFITTLGEVQLFIFDTDGSINVIELEEE